MHQIPAYETAVTLFSRDGNVWAYPSLKDALKALGERWIAANVGTHFRVFRYVARRFDPVREVWVPEPVYDEHSFIMRDDAGGVVTAATFSPLIERRRWRSHWSRMWETWNGEGPVPGVRCHRGGGHYYRRPQSMMERRQAALVLTEEGEVPPRGARNLHHLPNAWDDYYITSRGDRCWKRHRLTQWKAPRD
ncbi:hypothetical protein WJ96_06020 [Burkholderia ubonensis]|uniref:Uncharacterized protein n=1 Tax=Burkholderia ubonensis TaxID=101571 RepID=A0AAW3N2A3_9BURK|nr:hypothetical protein [Burkholderia ubonensis]KVP75313.1 hypothetical protein WJ93_07815 [Burkholderia ubonensis]KVP96781.1 hypothetical protein WJ97_12945 [Burkholderia ubonensis]KVP98126.1 hypothetical protein WJ96_06020 [Burkholderia ubonensis]KVZ92823.1 hypothetical protein WL25_17680 [Burkholderia ubonensis]